MHNKTENPFSLQDDEKTDMTERSLSKLKQATTYMTDQTDTKEVYNKTENPFSLQDDKKIDKIYFWLNFQMTIKLLPHEPP